PDGEGSALCLGGVGAADFGRAEAKSARKPARGADWMGAEGWGRERLHREPADAAPASDWALVRSPKHAAERRAANADLRAAGASLSNGPQHRHIGCESRSRNSGSPYRERRDDDSGSDFETHRRPGRRVSAHRRTRAVDRGTGAALGGD